MPPAPRAGQIAVPLMFRLAPPDIEYIVNHSGCQAFIVEEPFVKMINEIKDKLPVPNGNYIYLGDGPAPEGYIGYEDWLAQSSPEEQDYLVDAADPWVFMYTSGTTGRPKGVVRSHEANMSMYYLNNINMGVHAHGQGHAGHAHVPRELHFLLVSLYPGQRAGFCI